MAITQQYTMQGLNDVLTLREAAEWWGMTAKAVFHRLISEEKRTRTTMLRKSGDIWLTTVDAMTETYGSPRFPRPEYV
jgi:hypothetical protein